MHYGVKVQLIADRTNGDGGLEAFVASEGIAFQCYAPQDPLTIEAQTSGQKRKITTDTQKLIDHSERTVKLIGKGAQIKEWVLLTPHIDDKSLVEHAVSRSATVRSVSKDHPWCHGDFRISAHTDRLFPQELAALAAVKNGVLGLTTVASPATNDTESFDRPLREKLAVDPSLGTNQKRMDAYVHAELAAYFQGSAEMERLARDAPTTFQTINDCAALAFNGLASAFLESDAKQLAVVGTIRSNLAARLKDEAPGLQLNLAELIARYFVASWWLQCPLYLDGPDPGQANV